MLIGFTKGHRVAPREARRYRWRIYLKLVSCIIWCGARRLAGFLRHVLHMTKKAFAFFSAMVIS
jgi:hypothetical protein